MAQSAKVHDKAGEALEIGRVVCGAKKLATHLRPDIDAVLAIWICQRIRRQNSIQPAEVVFMPASTTSVDMGILGLDIGVGKGVQKFGRGRSLKRSSIRGSAAMAVYRALPEDDRSIIEPLVQAISDAHDKGENVQAITLQESTYPDGTKRWDNVSLRNQITATTIWAVFEDVANVTKDEEMVQLWSKVFDGLLASGLKKRQAVHASDPQQTEYKFDGLLAILPHNAPQQTSKAAYTRGAKLVFFSSYLGADQWTLGISRRSGDEARFIDFIEGQDVLKRHVPDLFIHPAGYMAGWTVKAPLEATADDFKDKRRALIEGITELVRNALETKG